MLAENLQTSESIDHIQIAPLFYCTEIKARPTSTAHWEQNFTSSAMLTKVDKDLD
jgi:hypothetical protein